MVLKYWENGGLPLKALLIGLVCASGLLVMGLVAPRVEAVELENFPIESDPERSSSENGTIEGWFFSLTDSDYLGTPGYAELHHNHVGNNVNWPERGPDSGDQCDSYGPSGQDDKSIPWLPQSPPGWLDEWGLDGDEYDNRTEPWNNTNPDVDNGDFFNLSGDCQSSPTDGGTDTSPQGGGLPGAWLHQDAFAGWTDINFTGTIMGSSSVCRTEGTDIDTAQFAGTEYEDFPRMWSGWCERDQEDEHGSNLFRLNDYAGWEAPGDFILTSSGVSIFRHTFNLSQESIDRIQNSDDAELELNIIADDWLQVYLNEDFITGHVRTVAGRGITVGEMVKRDLIHEGENVLAVQAVDKAAWHEGNGSADQPNAAGVAYQLNIEGELDPPDNGGDEDTATDLETDTMTPDKFVIPGENNVAIRAYVENTETMENEDPGDPPEEPEACEEDPDSQECEDYEEELAQWEEDKQAYDEEWEEKTSEPVTLGVRATRSRNRINPNEDSVNVGRLEPGEREERTFDDFDVDGNAQEGDIISFQSWADEEGYGTVYGSDPGTELYVARNFDMRGRVDAEDRDQDELTGYFWIYGEDIENHRRRALDGMSTGESPGYALDITLRVTEGEEYIEPLQDAQSLRGRTTAPSGQGYSLTWTASGNGSQTFPPQNTPARERIRARTQVKDGTVSGSRKQVCFELEINPQYRDWLPNGYRGSNKIDGGGRGGSYVSNEDCTTLRQVDRPYVTTEDGDVHGGAVQVDPDTAEHCENDGQGVHGQRRGSSPQGSKSTYAVAATGTISRFGSRDSTTSNILQFGNNPPGNYRAVCRPDLTDQEYYENLGFNIESVSTRNLNNIINRVNNGSIPNDSVVFANYSSLSTDPSIGDVTLEAGKRVTIVRVGGTNNIEVRGDISVEGGGRSETDDIPALALVAAGDIDINSGVDSIEAYISSNGTVDTCADVADITDRGVAPQCQDQLEIRGALLAQEIRFRRTYGDAGNTEAAETIVFTPWLYLSPPPGIFGVTNNIFTERPVWERLPFF